MVIVYWKYGMARRLLVVLPCRLNLSLRSAKFPFPRHSYPSASYSVSYSEPRSQEVQTENSKWVSSDGSVDESVQMKGEHSGNDKLPNCEKLNDAEDEQLDKVYRPFSATEDVSTYKKGSFQELFKNSLLVQIGDPTDKDVEGVVVAMKEDKLYIDFGGKFHGVVDLPQDRFGYYVGAKVCVRVKELESVGHFVGDSKRSSLLEADVKLIGLL